MKLPADRMDTIRIRGARTHNLANIDVDIPRDRLIVITGVSGSGKSSLAFDTIYADGQRRYVESLSAYARQFLSMMEKPDVDYIEGLSPAISIEQKSTSHNPRSTVGTITEIYDYLRLLYARVGEPRCPEHGISLEAQTISQMVDQVLSSPPGERLLLLAPLVEGRKGEHQQILNMLRAKGFVRVRIDGKIYDLAGELPALDLRRKHDIEAVVDRFKLKADMRLRLTESFETALELSMGRAIVIPMDATDEDAMQVFSSRFSCHQCGYSIQELEPRLFSFNNPVGACQECAGLGIKEFFDPERIVRAPEQSLADGAIPGWDVRNIFYHSMLQSLAKHYDFDITTPFAALSEKIRQVILYGSGKEKIDFSGIEARFSRKRKQYPFIGVIPHLEKRYRDSQSKLLREDIAKYLSSQACSGCNGSRLNKAACNVFIGQYSLPEITRFTVIEAQLFFEKLKLTGARGEIAAKILKEVVDRLRFLNDVGLEYLSLDRAAATLSGGEAQRIRLASQIGVGLVGVMYVLDEPSIGLHQRDNQRLLSALFRLRDLGNTVIVVEHDEEAIRAADHLIDVGPGAGAHGGKIVAQGSVEDIQDTGESLTGRYLVGEKSIAIPKKRRPYRHDQQLSVHAASGNNLKQVDLHISTGLFTCITGVSGSGKSTLINDTLYPVLAAKLSHGGGGHIDAAPCEGISGSEHIHSIIDIDQSPIGRTPRSNPATYTGLFTPIRELFANTPEARSRGYSPGRFSFNVKGGRCEACRGDGLIKVEMHFLPDIYVPCDTCNGRRYNRETLDIRYKGANINEVLQMTVQTALEFFSAVPVVAKKLRTLMEVGLSYIQLGQNATTLSGGEAQRVKLSRELSKTKVGATLYILDEPTTGLHFHDIQNLVRTLQNLCDRGNTIVVIEHNLDVIKIADWVVDLGHEGGERGGQIIATGTPEQVARVADSHTGRYLKKILPQPRVTKRRSTVRKRRAV